MEVPRDEDSEDDSDDDENKNGDSASTEGIIAKAKEEAKKNGDEEETKVSSDEVFYSQEWIAQESKQGVTILLYIHMCSQTFYLPTGARVNLCRLGLIE